MIKIKPIIKLIAEMGEARILEIRNVAESVLK